MKQVNKLWVLCGISASGKSTFCEQMLQTKDKKYIRVSRDEYRYMWRNQGVISDKLENLITKRVCQDIGFFLRNGYDVLYDATNLTKRYLDFFVDKFNDIADIEFVVFDVDVEECIRRDKLRKRMVGESVIRSQHKKFLELKKTFDFAPLGRRKRKHVQFKTDPKKKDCIVVDIDGTLAHMEERGAFDESWVGNDKVDDHVRFAVQSIKRANPSLEIIICSGRTDGCQELTEQWLKKYNIPYDKLFMRQTGDNRKDSIIKREIYLGAIIPHYNIWCIFDDRDQVCDELRSMGLKVFQVEEGNF